MRQEVDGGGSDGLEKPQRKNLTASCCPLPPSSSVPAYKYVRGQRERKNWRGKEKSQGTRKAWKRQKKRANTRYIKTKNHRTGKEKDKIEWKKG